MATANKVNNIYQHYYTASDVTVDLYSPATDKRVNIDQLVSIAYTHNISTAPIYTLGTLEPYFFSKGNSLVQGQMDIAFTDTEYMRYAINYLIQPRDSVQVSEASLVDGKDGELHSYKTVGTSKDNFYKFKEVSEMSDDELREMQSLQRMAGNKLEEKSLINVPGVLDIIITMDNTNSSMDGINSTITLKGTKFNAQSMAVSSQDETVLLERFMFMAKNIK